MTKQPDNGFNREVARFDMGTIDNVSIDEMVRDFTSVVPRSKSEVRRRLKALVASARLDERQYIRGQEAVVRDAYLGFDQEDYCEKEMERCGKCWGCIQYKNLERAYKIAKRHLPKQP